MWRDFSYECTNKQTITDHQLALDGFKTGFTLDSTSGVESRVKSNSRLSWQLFHIPIALLIPEVLTERYGGSGGWGGGVEVHDVLTTSSNIGDVVRLPSDTREKWWSIG